MSLPNKNISLSQNLPFLFISLALFVFIPISLLFTKTMGGDGVLYTSVAMNMAHGIGSLWLPSYTPTLGAQFYDHPALSMWLNAWLFRLFGDSFLVERFYCLIILLVCLWGLVLLWRRYQPAARYSLIWLPLICWICVPLTTRTFTNNAVEDLLTVCTTFASFAILQCIHSDKRSKFLWLILAAFLISCGFFSNALQAFFPFAIPFIYWLVLRKKISFVQACWQTILLIVLTAIMIGVVLLHKPAYQFMQHYFASQVLATFSGARIGNGDYQGITRLFGLVLIVANLLPLIFLTGIVLLIHAKTTQQVFWRLVKESFCQKQILLWSLIALSASLPILLSSRQMAHYFLQSFPFWILLFLEILTPIFSIWLSKMTPKIYKVALIISLLLMLAAIITAISIYGRPKAVLIEVNTIATVVPDKSTISVADDIFQDWNLRAYFYRYYYIALGNPPGPGQEFYLQGKNNPDRPSGYQEINLPLKEYRLFRKTN